MFYFVILTYLPNEPCFTLPDLRSSQMIYVLPRHMYVSPPINHVLSRHIYGSPQMNHILPNPIYGTFLYSTNEPYFT